MRTPAILALFALAIAVPAALLWPSPGAAAPGLDHYKCYAKGLTDEVNYAANLKDAIGQANYTVKAARSVCMSAVFKYKGKTYARAHPDDVYVLYNLDPAVPHPDPQPITISNQFGTQALGVRTAADRGEVVAIPSRRPSGGTPGLQVLKCYLAEGVGPKGGSQITDDFGIERGAKVLEPRLYCNPATLNGAAAPADNGGVLVCYNLQTDPFSGDITLNNVLGNDQTFDLGPVSHMLCVPSTKLS